MSETDKLSDELERFNFNSGEKQKVADSLNPRRPLFSSTSGRINRPYVELTEQPVNKYRYRYPCEKRSTGTITGATSTPNHKTYPTIKISNYIGNVRIIVSCVTKDMPYRPHPHSVVGREGGGWGAYFVNTRITEESKFYPFRNLGIQCVRKRDIAAALDARKQVNIDPFKTGFDHVNHSGTIDFNAVRLCFQVFILDQSNICQRPLPPVVSDIIYNYKTSGELIIALTSHSSGSAKGGTQVVLLCEKLTKEEVAVEFYLEENNQIVWTALGVVTLVHKECAIIFYTPRFRNPYTTEIVTVQFRLKRISDNVRSNPLPFDYLPDIQDRTTPLFPLCTYQMASGDISQADVSTPGASTTPPQNSQLWTSSYDQQSSVKPILPSMFPNIARQTQSSFLPKVSDRPATMQPFLPNTQSMTAENMEQIPSNIQPISSDIQPQQLNIHPWPKIVHTMNSNVQTFLPNIHNMSANVHPISDDISFASSSHTPWEVRDMSQEKGKMSPNLKEPLSAQAGHQTIKMETEDLCSECLVVMAEDCNAELKNISGDISNVIAGKEN